MTRLVYHPQPYPDEGLYGFLLRVVEGNRLQSIRKTFDGHDSLEDSVRTHMGWEAGPSSETRLFQQLEPSAHGSNKVWNHRGSRYCPSCLQETPHWRQEWELSLLTACPVHRCALIDICHQCGRTLDWNRGSLLQCTCGARLQGAGAIEVDEVEGEFGSLLTGRLIGGAQGPEHLQFLQLGQLHRLAVFLGAYAQLPPGRRSALKIPRFSTLEAVRPIARDAGAALLLWPEGFHRQLDGLRTKLQSVERSGSQFIKQFGSFYSILFSQFYDPEFSSIIYAFESYIAKNWTRPLAERNKLISEDLRQKHVWIPSKEAAHTLKTSQRKLAVLYEAERISGHVMTTPSGRKMLCIDRRELPQIAQMVRDSVNLKSAAVLLGVNKHRISELIRHDLLGHVIAPREHRSSSWILSRTFIQDLLRLGSALPEWEEAEVKLSGISLTDALRYLLTHDTLFPELIVGMIHKEIWPIAIRAGRSEMGAWVFDRAELKQWKQAKLEKRREGAMKVPKAARALGLSQDTTYWFLSRGILEFTVDPDSLERLVTPAALKAFQEKYVRGSEIATRLNISPRWLRERLERRGIHPVSGPMVDGSRLYLYLRDQKLKTTLETYEENPAQLKLRATEAQDPVPG